RRLGSWTMFDPQPMLRLCLRSRRQPAAAVELMQHAGRPGWNWKAVVACALAEGLAPILYTHLSRSHLWAALPDDVRRTLTLAYEGSALRSAALLTALEEILERLHRAGVAVLLLKGAAVAERLYGDPALRPMNDLDLLIHEADITKALAALMAGGYVATRVEERPGITIGYESEIALAKPGLIGIAVELHWHLFDSPFYQRRVDTAWFWETATSLPVAGHAVYSLNSTALFLYLAGHLMLHHRGEGLRWWLDLVELIYREGEQIEWPVLPARAEALALLIPLQATLATLIETWGVPVPAGIAARAHAMTPSAAERRAYRRLTAASRSVGQRFWHELADLPTWSARGRFAWAHMFPSPAYMAARYRPSRRWLLPLLYPWRWLNGLLRHM
ncbi:MAG: nucleotidyltransferase family protein, partial [Anaerolineae bacterium]|nr:nucleotidyltransferase family protein [Anaerolineae bacterium]